VKAKRIDPGLYITAALRLYYAKHQFYPANLSELSPEIIPEVPLDPLSDKPFSYKVDESRQIISFQSALAMDDLIERLENLTQQEYYLLKRITGQDFGNPKDKENADKWRQWWKEHSEN
jgi:hypothetical protein